MSRDTRRLIKKADALSAEIRGHLRETEQFLFETNILLVYDWLMSFLRFAAWTPLEPTMQ